MKAFKLQIILIMMFTFTGDIFAQSSDSEALDELLSASGISKTVNTIPQMFSASAQNLASQNSNIESAHLDALAALLNEIVRPELFSQEINKALSAELSPSDVNDIMAWYMSDVGKEISLAEAAAATQDGQLAMSENASLVMQNEQLVSRAKQISIATNAVQQLYSMTRNVSLAMYASNAKINEPTLALDLANLNSLYDQQKTQTIQVIQDQMLLYIAYSMQDIDDDKVQQYIDFLASTVGTKFVNATLRGLNSGFTKSVSTLVESIDLVFHSDDWRIDQFLTFSPPSDEDLTFQAFPELDINVETIAGWTGDDLNFFYNTAQQNANASVADFWASFNSILKKSADRKKVELVHEGTFTTNYGDNVEFKILMWREGGEVYTQIVNLIDNGSYRYMLQAFPLDIAYLEKASIRNVNIIKSMKLKN